MKIKSGLILRSVGGENVVVPVGEMSKKFHGMITLNETGVPSMSLSLKTTVQVCSTSTFWIGRSTATVSSYRPPPDTRMP